MQLTCKAKVSFSEGIGSSSRNHHQSITLLTNLWSFLEGDKRHTHTLKAGHHSFPFTFNLPGTLPASIHTFSNDAKVIYKLRADVSRSGFAAKGFHATRIFAVQRMFTPEALEFNQTLEIENTWPGKVMYAITLPFKAYAAGDDIPVLVKFMPLAKGVRVTTVTSVIKEYCVIQSRHSQNPDGRVVTQVKHELRNGRAHEVPAYERRSTASRDESQTNSSRNSFSRSRPPSPRSGSVALPRPADSFFPAAGDIGAAGSGSATATSPIGGPSAEAGPSSGQPPAEELWEDDPSVGDDEVNTSYTIPIPAWTTPSHTIHPVQVSHKLKWSCSISNADGHVSELRCALPIIILDHTLLDEARTSSAATRRLLFANDNDESQVVDLPSYSNHVYDRVAVADAPASSGFVPRSRASTPLQSPNSVTPPATRPVSRPASPVREPSWTDETPMANPHAFPLGQANDVPPRRTLSPWVDSELLASLGALRAHSNENSPNQTPPDSRGDSRGGSRPHSRRGSRSGRASKPSSRPGSRANSPDRERSSLTGAAGSGGGFIQTIKARTGINKPILRTAVQGEDGIQRQTASYSNIQNAAQANGAGTGFGNGDSGATVNGSTSNANGNADCERGHVSFAAHLPRSKRGPPTTSAVQGIPVSSTSASGSSRVGGGLFHVGSPDDAESSTANNAGTSSGTHSLSHSPSSRTSGHSPKDPLSQVPSYAIASKGFLGGGIVPLDIGLPTYDVSEMLMERSRSGTGTPVTGRSPETHAGIGGLAGGVGERLRSESGSGSGMGARVRSESALVDMRGNAASSSTQVHGRPRADQVGGGGVRTAGPQTEVDISDVD